MTRVWNMLCAKLTLWAGDGTGERLLESCKWFNPEGSVNEKWKWESLYFLCANWNFGARRIRSLKHQSITKYFICMVTVCSHSKHSRFYFLCSDMLNLLTAEVNWSFIFLFFLILSILSLFRYEKKSLLWAVMYYFMVIWPSVVEIIWVTDRRWTNGLTLTH